MLSQYAIYRQPFRCFLLCVMALDLLFFLNLTRINSRDSLTRDPFE
jgi:hypothetical protein